jgi:CheY-like chemotaxis protein/pimeloyl-ACP methyl ester carboxylesterase
MDSPVPSTAATKPGALLVPGWDDNHRERYRALVDGLAARGWACRLVDLPNESWSPAERAAVTREDNLRDVLAAYDALAREPGVERAGIGLIGVSYGGYLAAFASGLRPVRWLALRAPALYRDRGWSRPKEDLDKEDLAAYRLLRLRPEDNRALAACAAFRGHVMLIGSGSDDTVPSPVVENYAAAFAHARSLRMQWVEGADHALSHPDWHAEFRRCLFDWLAQRRTEPNEDAAAARAPACPRKLRILVVEDEPDMLTVTLELLQTLGHWVTGVKSAEVAINRFLEGAFDLLMTDVNLPALSGLDLAQKLQRHGFPVVFATGRPPPSRLAPGTFWLQKPYTVAQLEEVLRAASALVPAGPRGNG